MYDKRAVPGRIDLAAVAILWTEALATGDALGRSSGMLVWFAVGLLLGIVLARIHAVGYRAEQPGSEANDHGESLFQRVRRSWAEFAGKMGNCQSRILIMLLYFNVILPFGVGLRILSDPLNLHGMPGETGWVKREGPPASVQDARRQG
jgi:hypothetical protein